MGGFTSLGLGDVRNVYAGFILVAWHAKDAGVFKCGLSRQPIRVYMVALISPRFQHDAASFALPAAMFEAGYNNGLSEILAGQLASP